MKISWAVRVKLLAVAEAGGASAIARCCAGLRIAALGHCEQTKEGVLVKAPGKENRLIQKGQPCTCDDAKYRLHNRCKHTWAANAYLLAMTEQAKQTTRNYIV